mmetsp:Transcript_12767/g.19377  ORF Transcript_12767/g.19377 Transcript_12767/m.19377 type:complete len:210 (+) Transcript_12767:3058-3687(+)
MIVDHFHNTLKTRIIIDDRATRMITRTRLDFARHSSRQQSSNRHRRFLEQCAFARLRRRRITLRLSLSLFVFLLFLFLFAVIILVVLDQQFLRFVSRRHTKHESLIEFGKLLVEFEHLGRRLLGNLFQQFVLATINDHMQLLRNRFHFVSHVVLRLFDIDHCLMHVVNRLLIQQNNVLQVLQRFLFASQRLWQSDRIAICRHSRINMWM